MGNVRLGIDLQRVLELRDKYHLKGFIETGTWKGGTCTLAAQHFERVITIEAYRPRFEKTAAQFAGQYPNLAFWYGDSRAVLARALAELDTPCLLWLDGHWCGGGAIEAHELGDECPLNEELKAVLASKYAAQHMIMIDDARLFTSPPPYPHDPAQWPSDAEIERLLAPRVPYIEDDVIYAEPAHG